MRSTSFTALLTALLLAPAVSVAQDPAPGRPNLTPGTYAIEGRLETGGVYSGTVVFERQDGDGLRARFALTGADGNPLARPDATGSLRGGVLALRWPVADVGGDVEARYDGRAGSLSCPPSVGGRPYAREQLTPLTRLIIVHTNDSHGQVIPFKDPTTGRRVGGFGARATLVKRIRREAERTGAHVLVLDAGDVNTGVPESDLLDALPDLEAMNAIGYQAMALGNHEFDRGLATLLRQRNVARFPFLSANVHVEATGEPLVQASLVLERAGLRVGILGLTTESAAYITLPENRAGLRFEPALEAAAREVPRLRARCDLVIALTHLGYYADGAFGTSTPGDVNLVRAVKGIDVVVGGHTHTPLGAPILDSGAIIVQTQDRGRFVGRLDLLLDAQKKIVRHEARLLPVIVEDPADATLAVPEDAGIVDVVTPFLEQINGRLDALVTEAPVVLDGERAHVRAGDTNLAFLVTDAFRAAGESDLAFAVGGGIRSSIDAGPITYREVLTTLPFRNGLVRGKLTGAQVMDVLAIGARQVPPSGGWLQVSGLTWTMEGGKVTQVRVAGAPLDPAKVYTVTCDRFIGDGGEKYTPLQGMTERVVLPVIDNEALEAFLRARGVPDYAGQRRCTVVSTLAPPAPAPAAPAPAPAPAH